MAPIDDLNAAIDEASAQAQATEDTEASAGVVLKSLFDALTSALALGNPAAIITAVKGITAKLGTSQKTLAENIATYQPPPAP